MIGMHNPFFEMHAFMIGLISKDNLKLKSSVRRNIAYAFNSKSDISTKIIISTSESSC